jgi:Lrp/AsnC family transcriptional regulator, leucine-responsive regulatory protein
MPLNQRPNLDSTDNLILHTLQMDGRISIADLARSISMSPTSVADRVRRLSDHGVIEGYTAIVSAEALGYPLTAFIRLRLTVGTGSPFREFLDRTPQVLEAHHLAGEDCFLLKVVATSMPDLEVLANGLVTFGHVTTNLVFSSPVDRHPMPASANC